MNDSTFFGPRIADSVRRALSDHAGRQTGPEGHHINAALEELNAALEELRVADEELRQQNAELERAAECAELEHQRYYALFEFAPVGLFTTDHHGIIREANRAACLLLSCERPHLIGKPIAALLDNESSHEVRQLLSRVLACGGPVSCHVLTSPTRGSPRRLIATLEADTSLAPRAQIRWGLQPRSPMEPGSTSVGNPHTADLVP